MVLYKHDIFVNNVKTKESFFEKIEIKDKVETRSKIYVKESFTELNKSVYLFHYSRDKDVFSEDGKYFKVVEGKKTEIDIKEYKDLKKEYNYFVVIDVKNSKMYTADTTENKVTVNIEVINKFFGKKIKALNEVDYNKLIEVEASSIKLRYKIPKQMKIFGLSGLDKNIQHLADSYDANDVTMQFKGIGSKKIQNAIAKTKGDTEVQFLIEATNQHGKHVVINNRSISQVYNINDTNIKRVKIEEIINEITKYFTSKAD